jgi:hypothetical protein
LAADEHDRDRRVLHHEAQDRAGVMHGVGAVTDHDARYPFGDLLANGTSQHGVLRGAHVLAEHPEQLVGSQVGDVRQLGHRAVELARRERWDDGTGAVVEPAGDRAARPEQGDVLLARVVGKLLFGDLVDGLAVAGLVRTHDAGGGHAHVVAGE